MTPGMTAPRFVVEIQWHEPDQAYAAGFLREGQPWILNGALVGMGATQGEAVADLVGIAKHLADHGENFLTSDPISQTDRDWLRNVLREVSPQ